jgi:hypothetical protein
MRAPLPALVVILSAASAGALKCLESSKQYELDMGACCTRLGKADSGVTDPIAARDENGVCLCRRVRQAGPDDSQNVREHWRLWQVAHAG